MGLNMAPGRLFILLLFLVVATHHSFAKKEKKLKEGPVATTPDPRAPANLVDGIIEGTSPPIVKKTKKPKKGDLVDGPAAIQDSTTTKKPKKPKVKEQKKDKTKPVENKDPRNRTRNGKKKAHRFKQHVRNQNSSITNAAIGLSTSRQRDGKKKTHANEKKIDVYDSLMKTLASALSSQRQRNRNGKKKIIDIKKLTESTTRKAVVSIANTRERNGSDKRKAHTIEAPLGIHDNITKKTTGILSNSRTRNRNGKEKDRNNNEPISIKDNDTKKPLIAVGNHRERNRNGKKNGRNIEEPDSIKNSTSKNSLIAVANHRERNRNGKKNDHHFGQPVGIQDSTTKKPAIVLPITRESQVSNNIQSRETKDPAIALPNIKPSAVGGKLKDRNGRVSANAPNNILKNVSTVEQSPGQSSVRAKEINHNLEKLTGPKDAASKKGTFVERDFVVELPEMSNAGRKTNGEIKKTIGPEIPVITETIGVAKSHGMSHGRGRKNENTIELSVVLHEETTNKRISEIDNDEGSNGQHVEDSTSVADTRHFGKMRIKPAQPVGYQTDLRRILEKEKNAKNGSQNDTDCIVGEWGPEVTSPNTPGVTVKMRPIVQKPSGNGKPCPPLTRFYDNRDGAPPNIAELNEIPCNVTEWTPWENIPGTVLHRRSRERLTESELQVCPHLYEAVPREANTPVDCVMNEWSEWEYNNATGCKARGRYPEVLPENGGQACPDDKLQLQFGEVDCVMGLWSNWTIVEAVNGQCMFYSRQRPILVEPCCHGVKCGETVETDRCPAAEPSGQAVNCVVSEWGLWGPLTGNPNFEVRSRFVVEPAQAGGIDCPTLQEIRGATSCTTIPWGPWTSLNPPNDCPKIRFRSANADSCPFEKIDECGSGTDCVVGPWSLWERPANADYYRRTRVVLTDASDNGASCPELQELIALNDPNRTPDCVVGMWSSWVRTPGQTQYTRSREIVLQPEVGGAACPPTTETRLPFDCVVGEWGAWFQIGQGTFIRTRPVTQEAEPGGLLCPPLEETKERCVLTPWTDWFRISDAPCRIFRSRQIISNPSGDTTECGDLSETDACPVCTVGEWGQWTRIGQSGACRSERTRTIILQPDLAVCPPREEQQCIDCVWGPWGDWSNLGSANCQELRARSESTPASGGGATCAPPSFEVRDCAVCIYNEWGNWFRLDGDANCIAMRTRTVRVTPPNQDCPLTQETGGLCVDCVWGPYGPWDRISNTPCQESRSRAQVTASQGVGRGCQGSAVDVRSCAPCTYSPWGFWARLGGINCVAVRSRVATSFPATFCLALSEDNGVCVDCVWGLWGQWTAWNNNCERSRSRTFATQKQGPGNECVGSSIDTEQRACECRYGNWGFWSRISTSGSCIAVRQRSVISNPAQLQCTDTSETGGICVDCVWDNWNQWAPWTSNPCQERRSRVHRVERQGSGLQCTGLNIDERACIACQYTVWSVWFRVDSSQNCIAGRTRTAQPPRADCRDTFVTGGLCVDCEWGDWAPWSAWNNNCERSKSRAFRVQQQGVGNQCEGLNTDSESRACTCVYGAWNQWSRLPGDTCVSMRRRAASFIPNGQVCPDETETNGVCVDCVWGPWGLWANIITNPGLCRDQRTRSQNTAAAGAGRACPDSNTEQRNCITCQYGPWKDWARLTSPGVCLQSRSRDILVQPSGVTCLSSEVDSCVDCRWSEWSPWDVVSTFPNCQRRRTRFVEVQNTLLGNLCAGANIQQEDCADCEYDGWSVWDRVQGITNCLTRRTRNAIVTPAGMTCAETSEDQTCVNCQMSQWVQWAPWVNNIRGVCLWQRTRTVVQTPSAFGDPCLSTAENKGCPDCEYGAWSQFQRVVGISECLMRRTRAAAFTPTGTTCDATSEDQTCVNCRLSLWGQWAPWLDNGQICLWRRTRFVEQQASQFGDDCVGDLEENKPCPICQYGNWSPWDRVPGIPNCLTRRTRAATFTPTGTTCDVTSEDQTCVNCRLSLWGQWAPWLDNGQICLWRRTRFVEQQASQFGDECVGDLEENKPCPICQYGNWSPWDRVPGIPNCVLRRTREATFTPTGTTCDATSEDETCVNCRWSLWNNWAFWFNTGAACMWRRTRSQEQAASQFGDPCTGPSIETRQCPDCIYETWSVWSRSSEAGCVMERTRNVRFQPQTRVCNDVRQTSTCVDCAWGPWGQYQEIVSDPCDQQRTRSQIPPASNGGNPCVGSATENRPCPIRIINCEVGPWGPWQRHDGGNCMRRERRITVSPTGQGAAPCPDLEEFKPNPSPVDCLVSGWLEWKRLDSRGIEERIRRILLFPENGGEACPQNLRETRNVDVDCVVSQWSEYNRAPSSGSSTRQRYILISRQNNGAPCPSLIDVKIVVTPIDCVVGSWSAWERHLNFPYFERSRPILVLPNDAGVPCPKLFDFWSCDAPGQPTDDTGTAIVEHFFPTRPRDLLIIVDSSGSIPDSSYQLAKKLIVYLLEHMCGSIGQGVGQNRVALMHYSSTAYTIMDFHDSTDLGHVTTAVRTMGKASFSTCTGDALRHALLEVLLPEKGMRDPAVAPTQVILFTDGCENCGVDSMLAAQNLGKVAEIFTVAFGPEKKECYTRLLNYASYPKYQHVFAVDQYLLVNDLISRMDNLLRTVNPCS